jgi:hypothetical protein
LQRRAVNTARRGWRRARFSVMSCISFMPLRRFLCILQPASFTDSCCYLGNLWLAFIERCCYHVFLV